ATQATGLCGATRPRPSTTGLLDPAGPRHQTCRLPPRRPSIPALRRRNRPQRRRLFLADLEATGRPCATRTAQRCPPTRRAYAPTRSLENVRQDMIQIDTEGADHRGDHLARRLLAPTLDLRQVLRRDAGPFGHVDQPRLPGL